MIGKRKGIASSLIPFERNAPLWVKDSKEKINEIICNLAKKGLVPSQIGSYLRDSAGIPLVKNIAGRNIVKILKKNGLNPEIPEDLFFLIKKAINIKKHLERNKKDKDSKFRLILTESKIHRLSRYYKRIQRIPINWRFDSSMSLKQN
ncbi:40S ribosomal protein S13 [Guillardia theta]|uniref:40S ribosomal protein S13 n=1 Tax=Guillardia theta TaxID=55529 RepID=Q9AW88_GUITH|nr:40S ribosomal protein S13 [Guillardia theta]CAC26981.1 40S ribosomal protein S13 [Guillardia theta]